MGLQIDKLRADLLPQQIATPTVSQVRAGHVQRKEVPGDPLIVAFSLAHESGDCGEEYGSVEHMPAPTQPLLLLLLLLLSLSSHRPVAVRSTPSDPLVGNAAVALANLLPPRPLHS